MLKDATLILKIEPEMKKEFSDIAEKSCTTPSQLARYVIQKFIEEQKEREEKEEDKKWFLEQVDIGIRDAETNPLIPHEEVEERLKKRLQDRITDYAKNKN